MGTNNYGKKFEQNFQSSVKNENIFITRIQDSDLSFCGGNSQFTVKSLCDFIVFYKKTLFIIECKSTKYKSMSIDRGKNTGNKMISEHQIKNLVDSNQFEDVDGCFVFNFRNEEEGSIIDERTYIMNVDDFTTFLVCEPKNSINEKDIIRYGGILIPSAKKRKYYTYYFKEGLDNYLKRKE